METDSEQRHLVQDIAASSARLPSQKMVSMELISLAELHELTVEPQDSEGITMGDRLKRPIEPHTAVGTTIQ